MKVVIAKSLSAEKVERTFVVTGSQESVDRIAAFLGMLQFNGAIGHSGMFGLGWDGDGSDQVKIQGIEAELKQYSDGYGACASYGSDLEWMSALGSFGIARLKPDSNKLLWTARDGKVE